MLGSDSSEMPCEGVGCPVGNAGASVVLAVRQANR